MTLCLKLFAWFWGTWRCAEESNSRPFRRILDFKSSCQPSASTAFKNRCHYKTLSGGRGNIVAMFLGERITNNARKILVVRPQGIEPRIAGYKPGATNHITLGAYIYSCQIS